MNTQSDLESLQRFFWSTMREPFVVVPEIEQRFAGSSCIGAVDRMAVYRGMFWARQLAALEESFPRTLAILGGGAFREMTRAYLLAHPSSDPRLELLGQWLPGFVVKHTSPDVAREAAIEWSEMAVLLRPNEPPGLDGLGVAPDNVDKAVLSLASAMELVPFEEGGGTVVWRCGFAARKEAVPMDEWAALLRARAGVSLAAICDSFAEADDPPMRAASVLRSWLRRGWILGVTL